MRLKTLRTIHFFARTQSQSVNSTPRSRTESCHDGSFQGKKCRGSRSRNTGVMTCNALHAKLHATYKIEHQRLSNSLCSSFRIVFGREYFPCGHVARFQFCSERSEMRVTSVRAFSRACAQGKWSRLIFALYLSRSVHIGRLLCCQVLPLAAEEFSTFAARVAT